MKFAQQLKFQIMVINKQIEINNSIENVWKILGHDFAHPYKWASAVNHSEGYGKQIASIECDERACQTSIGDIREKLTNYSDEQHTLSYDIIEGLPLFVSMGKNKWCLTKETEHKTILHIQMEMILKPWAFFMSPMTKLMFNKLATHLSEDFAYFAENGKPHPRKLKTMMKNKETKKGLSSFYLVAFVVGTLTPLYFIANFIRKEGGIALSEFIDQLFANYAASTFSSDLLICSFIFWVFMVHDKKNKNLPNLLYFITLNLTIGLSSALPVYLYFRQKRNKETT